MVLRPECYVVMCQIIPDQGLRSDERPDSGQKYPEPKETAAQIHPPPMTHCCQSSCRGRGWTPSVVNGMKKRLNPVLQVVCCAGPNRRCRSGFLTLILPWLVIAPAVADDAHAVMFDRKHFTDFGNFVSIKGSPMGQGASPDTTRWVL
jgi:hypothetical protein